MSVTVPPLGAHLLDERGQRADLVVAGVDRRFGQGDRCCCDGAAPAAARAGRPRRTRPGRPRSRRRRRCGMPDRGDRERPSRLRDLGCQRPRSARSRRARDGRALPPPPPRMIAPTANGGSFPGAPRGWAITDSSLMRLKHMADDNRIRSLGRAIVTASTILALPTFGPPLSLPSPTSVSSRFGQAAPTRGVCQRPVRSGLASPPRIVS